MPENGSWFDLAIDWSGLRNTDYKVSVPILKVKLAHFTFTVWYTRATFLDQTTY